jgi:hypothetical protein
MQNQYFHGVLSDLCGNPYPVITHSLRGPLRRMGYYKFDCIVCSTGYMEKVAFDRSDNYLDTSAPRKLQIISVAITGGHALARTLSSTVRRAQYVKQLNLALAGCPDYYTD